jgi:tetratricopeptide (TPR) repeat protein
MKKTPVPRKYVSREIRVFVSSTFKDMFKEREVLGKQVFPELRRKCRDRDVEFTEVDLRWGVSSEKALDGAVEICLREIERCHPYFILLLGERYGYMCKPQEVARLHEISPEFQWLKTCGECSVTELEIRHAMFELPLGKGFGIENLAAYMRCYFRDPGYIDTLAPEVRSNYRDPENRDRLAALKDRIRSSGLSVAEYENPEALKDRVLKDLWEIIERKFPEGSQLSPLEKEALEHEAFARSRTRLYISRKDDFRRLDDHAAGNAPPLVILGESGIGKSALLANWALAYRENHPEDLLIFHFIGSSPNSSDYGAMLRRIMAEMKAHYDIGDEIPSAPKALREQFPMWLAKAHAGGRTILILDGLNQLADIDRARELAWLPEFIPENVRLFVSTINPALNGELSISPSPQRGEGEVSATETVYNAVEQRKDWQRFTINMLSESEQEQLIVNFLKRWGKELEPKYAKIITDAPQTANPLYLRVLLEELRLFGKGYGDVLKAQIEYYLEAPSPVELYQKVLARLEADYTPASHPDLVIDVFSMLWAARRGLTEKELLEILDIPHIHWSPLFNAAEESLVSRSGLLSFFHDYLRQATAQTYLPDAESKRSAHLRLADYFEKQEINSRTADELPYHLDRAGDMQRLKACIREIPMFLQLYEDGKIYELMGYWLNAGGYEVMEAEYAETIKGIEDAYTLSSMGYFLMMAGCQKLTEEVFRKALVIFEKILGENHPNTTASINNLAFLLNAKGDYAEAEPLYRKALAICEKVSGENHPDTALSINNLACLLGEKGDYAAAEPLFRKALDIREKVLGENHPHTASSIHNLASLLKGKGDYAEAEPLYRKALAI